MCCRWRCPGILTGTIIGVAKALGETAPLLMIGMVAFVVDVPQALTRAGDRPAGADLSVVATCPSAASSNARRPQPSSCSFSSFVMNVIADLLRRRFERRW